MYCTACGALNDDNAWKCTQCGRELLRTAAAPVYVPNYLVQAILVTVFCCLWFGIPAIIFAAQVNGKAAAGDIAGATDSSRKAKMWCWIALGCGLFFDLAYIGFLITVAIVEAASKH
jgi:hypothetical protein